MGSGQTRESRQLELIDGKSKKFWNIELDGTDHTVNFGRLGTNGQTKTKSFDSASAAKKAYDKLVAEKLKKGYVDSGDAQAPADRATDEARRPSTDKRASKKVASAASAGADGSSRSHDASAPTAKQASEADEATTEAPASTRSAASPAGANRGLREDGKSEETSTEGVSFERTYPFPTADWFQVTFDLPPPVPRGDAPAFDQADAVKRMSKLRTEGYRLVQWRGLAMSPAMSGAEAHFWLWAMTTMRTADQPVKAFAAKFSKKKFEGDVDEDAVFERLVTARTGIPAEAVLPIVRLISPQTLFEAMLEGPLSDPSQDQIQAGILQGWRQYVLPYLSRRERSDFKKRLRETWDPTHDVANTYARFPSRFYLAAGLGLHDELSAAVSSWGDDHYRSTDWADHYQQPQEILLGLGSSDEIAAHWSRLQLRFRAPDQVRRFIACTRHQAVDIVAQALLRETSKADCGPLVEAFATARLPEVAPAMLRLKLESKAPQHARNWLDQNVGQAALGSIMALGQRGKVAEAAVEHLRALKKRGHGGAIEAAMAAAETTGVGADRVRSDVLDFEEKVYAPLDDETTPPKLVKALRPPSKAKKLPGWATVHNLPPLCVGEFRLSDAQVGLLLQALMQTPVDERHPAVTALRELAEPKSRDAFTWALFEMWRDDGFPSKDKWAMVAIGHLGGDASALKLAPLIRVWPGESQHARAVLGLQCLRAIGSNTALMQLSGIAQKLKFKGLKAKAQLFVEAIAEERGLTTDELEDRVVPDCGLDADGRRTFSFGPRSFEFVLGDDLKAQVRDAAGKVRTNLPKPGAKDDAAEAEAATEAWKLLKKQIKDVANIQAARLEQAMVVDRRWAVSDFEKLLVQHPLMTHLVQKLVWSAFRPDGDGAGSFRVTEERDYASIDDAPFMLPGQGEVGIVHPLHLDDDTRARWGEVMGDYELVSPFPQLGRDVHTLSAHEGKGKELDRYAGLTFSAPTLVYNLDKFGWLRGAAMDAGGFDEHSKPFLKAGVTAVVTYDGTVGMGYIDPDETLTMKTVYFCQGIREPSGYGWGKNKLMKLSSVPPVVLSEVLNDLEVLKAKAR